MLTFVLNSIGGGLSLVLILNIAATFDLHFGWLADG